MGSGFNSVSVGCSRSAQVAFKTRWESSGSAHAAVTENHSLFEISRQICEQEYRSVWNHGKEKTDQGWEKCSISLKNNVLSKKLKVSTGHLTLTGSKPLVSSHNYHCVGQSLGTWQTAECVHLESCGEGCLYKKRRQIAYDHWLQWVKGWMYKY